LNVLDVDWNIILKWIMKKYFESLWGWFFWLKVGGKLQILV
jgi:hypothetical protein